VLGLTKQLGPKKFRLLYLWYRWPGEAADRHAAELERFRAAVGDEVVFEARAYQEVFAVLRRAGSEHASYIRYLEGRYFRQDATPRSLGTAFIPNVLPDPIQFSECSRPLDIKILTEQREEICEDPPGMREDEVQVPIALLRPRDPP